MGLQSLIGVGGAYAISAGLVIYADQNGILDAGLRLPVILGWAAAGLALAFIAAVWPRQAAPAPGR